MVLKTFYGGIIFLVANISLLYSAHLVVRKFLPKAPHSVRLVASGLMFYSGILLVFQALSPFNAITRVGVVSLCLLIAAVSHFLWGKQRKIYADIGPLVTWLRLGTTSRWAALIICCGFVVFLSFTRALLMPPLAWDSLTYHLPLAAFWIKKGALVFFAAPDQIINCSHFPINGELFAAWLLLPFHSDLIVNTMNFPLTFLGGLACYAIARELGMSIKEASWAPVLICFSPFVYAQITTQYVDTLILTFCLTALLFVLRYIRGGAIADALLAFSATGIMIGAKYTAIPLAGIVFIALMIKMKSTPAGSRVYKIVGFTLAGLLICCALGGRQYIRNSIEAHNPVYPLEIKAFNHTIFNGYGRVDWNSSIENPRPQGTLAFIRSQLSKFSYQPGTLVKTAGPKFLFFFVLAIVSLFARPPNVSRGGWAFFLIMWVVPIVVFSASPSTRELRQGRWDSESIRFLSAALAFFTIQGLLIINRIRKYFKEIDFILVMWIAWDLFYVNVEHLSHINVVYPCCITIIVLGIVVYTFVVKSAKTGVVEKQPKGLFPVPGIWRYKRVKQVYIFGVLLLALSAGLYTLQVYRNKTRYTYYDLHTDYGVTLTKGFSSAWAFLDKPNEKRIIAMGMDWEPPGHKWFVYPLFGSWLQNEVVYVSAKYREDVPTWRHRGLLRGEDFSIWLYNVKRKNVDYVMVTKPWPIELSWMQQNEDDFTLVKSGSRYQLFKYNEPGTLPASL